MEVGPWVVAGDRSGRARCSSSGISAADWRAGLPVEVYQFDRVTGAIVADRPVMTVIPTNPRLYYRGRTNYVDGRATVLGMEQELVFGLSHIAPAAGGLEAMREFNRWACGLAARE